MGGTEVWARLIRDNFVLLTIAVFVANNLHAFQDNEVLMYLFFGLGILALVSTEYVSFRGLTHGPKDTPIVRKRRFSSHRQGGDKVLMKWLKKNAAVVGVLFVLGAAIALYAISSLPSKPWWGVSLVAIGPLAMWIARLVERRGRDNENLIRQLVPLVEDAGDLEFTIRNFARDLLSNSIVRDELENFGVQGWTYYVERLGDQQLSALSSLKKELQEIDPFKELHVLDAVATFNQILGRVLEIELRLVDLCRMISTVPPESQSRWEYIQQAHQRMGAQLNNLRPILSEKGSEDLFDTFVNQPPQNLGATT